MSLTPRSKALCVAAIVASAVAIWSWLRQPAVGPVNAAAVSQAAPAIDPARRAAAIALARMPEDDPWAYAEKVAASAPEARKPTCGMDEAPQPAERREGDRIVTTTPSPAGPGYVAAMHRVDQALRLSADPFDRAVADALDIDNVLTPERQADVLLMGPPLQRLVEDALATSDPRVYSLAFGACTSMNFARAGCQGQMPSTLDQTAKAVYAAYAARCVRAANEQDSCGQLSARRWASLDPGNAAPWLFLLGEARNAGDASGQQEALAQMAAASRFDERLSLPAAAVAEALPDDDDALAAKTELTTRAMLMQFGVGTAFQALTQACRDKAGGDANLVQQCVAVSDVMFHHSDGLMAYAIGGSVYKLATGDPSRLDAAHAEIRAFGAHWTPATGFSPCDDARSLMSAMARKGKVGELEASREQSRASVTP